MISKRILHLLFHFICIIYQANAFSMKMYPIDSPLLKILPESFTAEERHQYLVNMSLARSLFNVNNKNANLDPNSIEYPLTHLHKSYFLAQLEFGTRDPKFAPFVIVDMTSSQTWFECAPCDPCFNSEGSLKVEESTTFEKITLKDERCDPKTKYDGSCSFDAYYGKGHAEGYLAKDIFTFEDSLGGRTSFPNIAFGCGIKNNRFSFEDKKIAGVHGFGLGPRSFLNQTFSETKGRFSYCIPRDHGETTILFGDAAQIKGNAKTIAMNPNAHYHLYLESVSLFELHSGSEKFKLDDKNFKSGFFVDPGTPITLINTVVYLEICAALVAFMDRFEIYPVPTPHQALGCYPAKPPFPLPEISFHFSKTPKGGGDVKLTLDEESTYYDTMLGGFCLKLLQTSGPSIFGAQQQATLGLLFDVNAQELSFAEDNC